MAEVEISYKGSNIATMNASGTKTLLTEAQYMEDDVTVTYTRPAAPSGTKNISITQNGATTEDVTSYASAQITANVPNTYSAGDEGKVVSNGALVAQGSDTVTTNDTYDTTLISSLTVNVSGGGISVDDLATNTEPSGAITLSSSVTQIKDNAFRGKPITSITGAGVTSIAQDSLNNTQITSITDANFPVLGVSSNFKLRLRLPSTCTSIKLSGSKIDLSDGSAALRYNTGLVSAEFPNHTSSTGNFCFAGCTNLALVDFGKGNFANGNVFNGDTKLRTLILRKTSAVQTLSGWSANMMGGIYNNPTLSTIYVPNALISSYQTASNWSSAYAAGVTFAKIEGSIYELT